MNKVILIGRLSRDPELRHTANGTAVCQINVAISRPVAQGKEPETDFINVTVWNKPAENIAKYLSKGRQVAIEGRIQTRSYDNNEGKKTYVTEVIANNVEFLGSANDNNRISTRESEENQFDANIQPPETTNIDNDPFASFGEKVEISDNDLPF